jgi:GT2 family glycosyltransferase
MAQDPQVGITAGFVCDGSGENFLNRYVVADTMGRAFWFDDIAPAREMIVQMGETRAFLTATGCNMAFRRSAVDSVSGFDPFYQYFLEETDLVFRLLALGHRCEVVPSSRVSHRRATNVVRLSSFDVEKRIVVARSQIHYIGKFGKSTFTPAEIESCVWERVLIDLEKIAWDMCHEKCCGEYQSRYLSRIADELEQEP